MVRKSILLAITFLCSLSLAAQEGTLLQRADSLLNARYHRIKYDTNYKWEAKFPQCLFVARVVAIRSWERWFAGLTAHYMYTHLGSTDLIAINNNRWHIMAIAGFRL